TGQGGLLVDLGDHDALLAHRGREPRLVATLDLTRQLYTLAILAFPLERVDLLNLGFLRGFRDRPGPFHCCLLGHDLILGHSVHFRQAGDTLFRLHQRGLAQASESFILGYVGNLHGVAVFHDDALDGRRHLDHFIYPDTPFITVLTIFATHRPVNR